MNRILAAVAATLAFGSGLPAGLAHSLGEFEDQLKGKERYFQAIDRPAPDFELTDTEGRRVSLDDLRGKVVVLHFVYASCPDSCPLHTQRLVQVQDMVNATPMREQVQFVGITTDPERDSAAVLDDYAKAQGVDTANWTFLTSGADRPEATRELAERFGHKFTLQDGGYQMHGVVTHVIDQSGELRANFHGMKFEPSNLVLYVNALVNDPH